MKAIVLTAAAVVMTSSLSFAAIPKGSDPVRAALELPMGQRVSSLRRQGPEGYKTLAAIMFDEKESMATRWKAVTAAGRLGGKSAQPEIERALKHETWYMRNAGLVAMRGIDNAKALSWAKRLLDDKALLVRVAAVEAIGEIGSSKDAPALWEKLNSKQSFKKGQSLFIRQRIVEALARIESSGKEAAFMQILNDPDVMLHQPAIQALERMTRKSFGSGELDLKSQRAQWLNWWKTTKG